MSDGKPMMQRPALKYEININTLILLVGILVTGAGWGVTWEAMRSGQQRNAEAIETIRLDIGQLKAGQAEMIGLRYRVEALEVGAKTMLEAQRELVLAQRDFERSVSALASDVRVTREIVQRLDQAIGEPAVRRR